jgi:hypothetical protein
MESQFDAIIVLGRPGTLRMASLTAERCAEEPYMKMRLARMALNVEQVRQASIADLRQICAARLRDRANETVQSPR